MLNLSTSELFSSIEFSAEKYQDKSSFSPKTSGTNSAENNLVLSISRLSQTGSRISPFIVLSFFSII